MALARPASQEETQRTRCLRSYDRWALRAGDDFFDVENATDRLQRVDKPAAGGGSLGETAALLQLSQHPLRITRPHKSPKPGDGEAPQTLRSVRCPAISEIEDESTLSEPWLGFVATPNGTIRAMVNRYLSGGGPLSCL